MTKTAIYIGIVVLASLLLYPKFPSAVLTFFGLIALTALIINWNKITANFT